MKSILDSVELSLQTKNWYAALLVALTLPDVAGKIEYSGEASFSKRYADWFEKYCGSKYIFEAPSAKFETLSLSGFDCYALKCAFLHEVNSEVSDEKKRQVSENFIFISPLPTCNVIHRHYIHKKLQLQVDIFVRDILNGIRAWFMDLTAEFQKQGTSNKLLEFMNFNSLNPLADL